MDLALLQSKMNYQVQKVQAWLLANKLSVHYVKKSQYMLVNINPANSPVGKISHEISHFDGDATAKCATVSKFVIHSFSPRFSKAIRRRISTPFRKLRFHSEIRRRFVVSFHHCFENFDFTSKFEGGSPSHFDPVSTFIHSRYCFELRRRFAVSFRHCFENFDFNSKFDGGSPSHSDTVSTFLCMQ